MQSDPRYIRASALWMAIYLASVVAAQVFIAHHRNAEVRYAVASLPMVPLCVFARETVRHLGRLDELHRRIQLEALAITVLVTALLTLTYGFLEKAGLPPISVLWVWPWMAIIWTVATALTTRRYLRA